MKQRILGFLLANPLYASANIGNEFTQRILMFFKLPAPPKKTARNLYKHYIIFIVDRER